MVAQTIGHVIEEGTYARIQVATAGVERIDLQRFQVKVSQYPNDGAILHQFAAEHFRQAANTVTLQDHLAYKTQAVGAQTSAHGDRFLLVPVDEAQVVEGFEQGDALVVCQFVRGFRQAMLVEVIRRGKKTAVQTGHMAGNQTGVGQRPQTQGQVDAFFDQIHRAGAQLHVHLDAWVGFHERGDDLVHHEHADLSGHGQAQTAAQLGFRRANVVLYCFKIIHQRLGAGKQLFTFRRKLEFAGCALNQPYAQGVFQLGDATADGGFLHIEAFSRGGETAGFYHADKKTQVVKVHSLLQN